MKLNIIIASVLIVQSIQLASLPLTFLHDMGAILCMVFALFCLYERK